MLRAQVSYGYDAAVPSLGLTTIQFPDRVCTTTCLDALDSENIKYGDFRDRYWNWHVSAQEFVQGARCW